jgi:putative ABC transport system permease protein
MWVHDLRVGVRSAFKASGFSSTVIAVLAIAIAAATATFSVAYHVLLAPLPIEAEERVVLLQKKVQLANTLVPFAASDLIALRERCRTCDSASGVQYDGAFPAAVQDGDATLSVRATLVAGDFFDVLGARIVAGRSLTNADGLPGAEHVIVIGEPLWRRQWGGDPGVIGRRVTLRDLSVVIVGVVAAGFEFPARGEVWQPLTLAPAQMVTRDFRPYSFVVRLKDGGALEQFTQEAAAFLRERQALYGPRETKAERLDIQPLRSAIVGDARGALFVIAVTVGLLLFAAMADVVGLVLIRNIGRLREYGVRSAIGATRWHLVRQLVVEMGLLIATATALAAIGAWSGVRILVRLAPETLPRLDQVTADWRALLFGVGVAIVCTLVAGLAPALWTTRTQRTHGNAILLTTRSPSHRQGRAARHAVVVLQMGLVTTILFAALVVGAGLGETRRAGVGFDTRGLSVVYIPMAGPRFQTPEARQAFFDQLSERLRGRGGIEGATPVLLPPFTGAGGWDAVYTVEGQSPGDAATNPGLDLQIVSPNYLDIARIALLHGRAFTPDDRRDALPVVIVSQALARRAWPTGSAVGRRVKLGTIDSPAPWLTVVGVAADTRYRKVFEPPASVYLPLAQTRHRPDYLLVRTAGPAASLATIRGAARELTPSAVAVNAVPLDDLFARELTLSRFEALILGCFATISLILALTAVYGALSASVRYRSAELAVRAAMGATPRDLYQLIALQGLALTGLGVVLALPVIRIGSSSLARLQPAFSEVVAPAGVATLVVVALVGALATTIPALRAARTNIIDTLRND